MNRRIVWLTWLLAIHDVSTAIGQTQFASTRSDRAWVRFATSEFTILSNVSGTAAGSLASDLPALQTVFATFSWIGTPGPAPAPTIFLLSSDDWDRYLRNGPAADATGYFVSNLLRNDILVNAGSSPPSIIAEIGRHEYTHYLLTRTGRTLPIWFHEGLSMFLSTLRVTDSGIVLGKVPQSHENILSSPDPTAHWMSIEDLLNGRYDLNESDDRRAFYDESWALLHYFLAGQGNVSRLADLLDRIAGGEPTDEAFAAAFGVSYAQFEADLIAHIRHHGRDTRTMPVQPAVAMPISAPVLESTALHELSAAVARGGRT